ncbi:hypothetical protein G9A89_013497 [Geosiphon pyriformis]|nr:hypothetical protein G9A89_013497 [Geosiphon pyriformis]
MRRVSTSLLLIFFFLFCILTLRKIKSWYDNYYVPYHPNWVHLPLPSHPNSSQECAEHVKAAFIYSFNGYRKHAWGFDEVQPVTGGVRNSRNGWAATIVDSLDTMLLMNLTTEYQLSRHLVATIDFKKTFSLVNVFETTIRYIGGLIAAYELTNDNLFLDKAIELGRELIVGFDTPTGIPLQYVDFKKRRAVNSRFPGSSSALAEIGSIQLEFRRLTELSGDPIYLEKAQKIIDILQSQDVELSGLYSVYIDPKNGKFTTSWITWGGLGDSMYEYLLKQYIMVEGKIDQYRDMWLLAVNSTKKYLITTGNGFPNMTYLVQWWQGKPYYEMSHLGCFAGGNFLLGGKFLKDDSLIDLGLRLTDTCYQSYHGTETGIGPEEFALIAPDGTKSRRMNRKQRNMYFSKGFYVTEGHYYLRPEVIESIFYAYRITGDPKYREWGWNIFRAIDYYCKTPLGYSGIRDVTNPGSGWDNIAESFWYGETLKYLYLLFKEEELLPLDKWVLNTEAHPFRIGGGRVVHSRQFG